MNWFSQWKVPTVTWKSGSKFKTWPPKNNSNTFIKLIKPELSHISNTSHAALLYFTLLLTWANQVKVIIYYASVPKQNSIIIMWTKDCYLFKNMMLNSYKSPLYRLAPQAWQAMKSTNITMTATKHIAWLVNITKTYGRVKCRSTNWRIQASDVRICQIN